MDPPSGAVGVSVRQPVRLSFSKSMRRDDVEHAVHFFPSPPTPPRVHWEGSDLVLSPDTVWDTAQTYVVTLPTEATDVRGNRLSTTYQAAFSTGSQIDTGKIEGQVLLSAKPASNAWVLCYREPGPDINPELDSADYVVQTDAEGRFALAFLRPGTYRVFALADRDGDWLWNIGVEDLGVPAGDLTLDSAGVTRRLPALHLADLDTVRPVLLNCTQEDGWWSLEFDDEWLPAQVDSLEIFLVQGADTSRLEPLPGTKDPTRRIFARAPAQVGESAELLVRQAGGNRPAEGCIPAIETRSDTARAFAPKAVRPDTTQVWMCPPSLIRLQFNEPVATSAESLFAINGWHGVLQVESRGAFEVLLRPDWEAVPGEATQLQVARGAVHSESGHAWPAEDTFRLTLPLLPKDSTGDYEMRIGGWPRDPASESVVELRPVKSLEPVCRIVWPEQGIAKGRLAGGDYLLSLLQDRDGDGVWSAGWPSPFVPSERLWYPTDTLRVRPRFTVEFSLDLVR